MIAFKGFNNDLTCTLGKGKFQYEVGKTYREDKAQCASTGFHCVEEPIEVIRWYRGKDSRYCIVKASGDIHEDGDKRISCTEMTILREITLEELGLIECEWQYKHPEREYSSWVEKETGMAKEGDIVVVRGKHPRAAGKAGSWIFLIQEEKGTKEIKAIGGYQIDGKDYIQDVYYNVEGRRVKSDKGRTKEAAGA